MTANSIYKMALALLSQAPGDNEKWDGLAVDWINLLLAESWTYENWLRQMEDGDVDMAPQEIEKLEDEIYYHPQLKAALVDGLASILWEDAGESYKAQDYRGRMDAELKGAMFTVPEKVNDVYGGEC